MKLSKAQQEILDLMNNGWELGKYGGLEPKYSIQKGGLGRGGESKIINYRTILALYKKGLIKSIGGWNPERFHLVATKEEDAE